MNRQIKILTAIIEIFKFEIFMIIIKIIKKIKINK